MNSETSIFDNPSVDFNRIFGKGFPKSGPITQKVVSRVRETLVWKNIIILESRPKNSFLGRPQHLTTLPSFSASQFMLFSSRASGGGANVLNMRPRPPASRPQAAGRPWPSRNIGYGHFFKGVFSENTLYTFSKFQEFDNFLYMCIFGVRFRSRNGVTP